MSDELPQGWVQARLGAIATVGMGETILARQLTPSGLPVYSAGQENTPWGFVENPKKPLGKGTVVVSARGSIGFPKIPQAERFTSTQTTIALRFPDENLAAFACLWLKTVDWSNLTKGGAIPMLTVGDINELTMPLSPEREQRRIVAKLEKLLQKVDASKKRLDKIPVILKRFRQSVLAAACSGRLTEDWRKVNLCATSKSTSVETPFEVPDTWRWIKLPEAGEMRRGKSKHRPRDAAFLYGGHYPFIQTGDIAQSGGIIISHKQTYSEAGLEQSRLWPKGTICITIAANIAESAILTYPACFPDSVVGIIANKKICVPEYVEYFIRVAKSDISAFAPATAQKNINIAILSEVKVPIPPLPEQQEIVRRVESLFKKADEIEARYKKAKAYVDKLTQSILAKAFRGELVPQDPNDEPASVLLERIKAEQVKQRIKKKSKRNNS